MNQKSAGSNSTLDGLGPFRRLFVGQFSVTLVGCACRMLRRRSVELRTVSGRQLESPHVITAMTAGRHHA